MNNIAELRAQFPILQQTVNGKPLVYLDNAATSQKPLRVIEAVNNYYTKYNSNIHRGAHHLAQLATEAYENARNTIANYINANPKEVNFVRGTTEAVNLVASTYGRQNIQAGDEILISGMEHHSNIVPWQMLCIEKGAVLKVIPVLEDGTLDMAAFDSLLTPKTKIVSVVYVSNSLGTINPVEDIIKKAHQAGAVVFLDGAQALPHLKVDVQALDCDFLAFSGHKVYGPTGIGVLYGKQALLEAMPPYMGGGEMIKTVSFKGTTYNDLPYKFEAGTPNIEAGIVLGEAIAYMQEVGVENIAAQEQKLLHYATEKLQQIEGLRIIGTSSNKSSVISFLVGDVHPYDIGVLLNEQGIAIRTGHHCCQPLMERFGIEGTCRASFSFYNTIEEADTLVKAVEKAAMILA